MGAGVVMAGVIALGHGGGVEAEGGQRGGDESPNTHLRVHHRWISELYESGWAVGGALRAVPTGRQGIARGFVGHFEFARQGWTHSSDVGLRKERGGPGMRTWRGWWGDEIGPSRLRKDGRGNP